MIFEQDVIRTSREIPVLVVFSTKTCAYCHALNKVLSANNREDVTYLTIDLDQFPDLGKVYQIRSVPTLILFNITKPIARINGSMSGIQLNNWLDVNLPVEWTEV